MILNLDSLVKSCIESVDSCIESLLPKDNHKLSLAMRYSVLSPGKRLRPFILLETAKLFDIPDKYALRAAASIEIIHSYSLIHDDLPAMDDDDFRRGLPSCHKKFDEATAILAGDALLTLAFEILASEETFPDPLIRCNLIKILAESIGYNGIAGGQMQDLIYEKQDTADKDKLLHVQYLKTAKLFIACCQMAATLGKANDETKAYLTEYARNFGLAFQLIDDLEDITEQRIVNNNNIVKFIGKDQTLVLAKEHINSACNILDKINTKKDLNILKLLAKRLLTK